MSNSSLRLTAVALAAAVSLLTACGGNDKPTADVEKKPAATQDATKGAPSQQGKEGEKQGEQKTRLRQKVESMETPKSIPAKLPVGSDRKEATLPITVAELKKAGITVNDETEPVEVTITYGLLVKAQGTADKDESRVRAEKFLDLFGKPDAAWVQASDEGSFRQEMLLLHWETHDGGMLVYTAIDQIFTDGTDKGILSPKLVYMDAKVAASYKAGDGKYVSSDRHPDHSKFWETKLTLK